MLIAAIVLVTLGLCIVMAIAWRVQRRTQRSGWIDAIWSFSTGAACIALALAGSLIVGGTLTPRALLVSAMAACWSLRLGSHIAARAPLADDPRYADLMRQWGADASRRLFWFLELQAVCILPLALSALIAALNPAAFPSIGDAIGVLIFVIALSGEALADRQLKAFKKQRHPRGAICDVGLWSWTRHPNYFFETMIWLAYPAMAINLSGDYNWGWLAFAGAGFIYYLLAFVSGVPLLEAHMLRSHGDAFAAYQKRVSAFFPAPPRPRES